MGLAFPLFELVLQDRRDVGARAVQCSAHYLVAEGQVLVT